MSLKSVRLRTAHYIANVWHPTGAEVQIPEEHFDANLHEAIAAPAAAAPAASPPGAEGQAATAGALTPTEGIQTALGAAVGRIEQLEQTSVHVNDHAALAARVEELERRLNTPADAAPPQPPPAPDVPPTVDPAPAQQEGQQS